MIMSTVLSDWVMPLRQREMTEQVMMWKESSGEGRAKDMETEEVREVRPEGRKHEK